MLQLLRKKAAFTLIELLVVVIIVAVLAAVGIPLLSANVVKAKASEAIAGLGTIRTGMRAQLAEFGSYSTPATFDAIGIKEAVAGVGGAPGTAGDLDGRYFLTSDYDVVATGGGAGFCASVTGGAGAPGADADTIGLKRSMDETGDQFQDTTCGVVAGP